MRQRMNILYIIDSYVHPGGGTEGQLLELIRGLSREGVSPRLGVLRPTRFTREDAAQLCPVRSLEISRLLSLRTAVQLFRFALSLRRERIDVVHVFFNDAALVIPVFAKLSGCKVVVSRRDMGLWYSPGRLRLARLSNRFVDRIIANSRAVANHVLRHEKGPPEKVEVIYNGYSTRRLEAPAQPDLRERLGIGKDDPIIGMVANLRPVKRPADAIHAFARTRRDHPSAHLILVGEGALEGDLKTLAEKLGVRPFVHMLGSLPDVIPIVKHFRVGLLCSESEGFSNALLEYMACGVPPVCTRVGGNEELIEDGKTGYLVPNGDVQALASRMSALLADRNLRDRIGGNARAAVDRFSIGAMVSAHLATYLHLMAPGSPP